MLLQHQIPNLITGNNTRFRDQLKAGDRIVLKGMTHVVANVDSQTQITITPDYRGVNQVLVAKVNLITDKKVLTTLVNLDKMDGTGQQVQHGCKVHADDWYPIQLVWCWFSLTGWHVVLMVTLYSV